MSRKSTGLVATLCLMVALFAVPVFAHAVEASVIGTVSAVPSGVETSSVMASLYLYDSGSASWDHHRHESLNDDGTFSFSSVVATETYFVRVYTESGAYEAVSAQFATVDGGTVKLTPVLAKETFGPDPRTSGFDTSEWSDSENYTNEDVEFNLSVSDRHRHFRSWWVDGSGVATISYSINGAAFVTKAQTSKTLNRLGVAGTFTAEGVNTIKFFAVDRNGNVGKMATRLVYIDKTAPMTAYDRATATGQTIMLVATDTGSGVAGTLWRIGGTGEFKPGNVVPVPAMGISTLEFYSVDKAGNAEAVKSMTIQAKASLTKPKASTAKPLAGKKFFVSGAVIGRPLAVGSLRVYKVVNGKYKYVGKTMFKASSTGSYKVAFKLKKGTYRFMAFYGGNTVWYSNPAASSAYSVRSIVK